MQKRIIAFLLLLVISLNFTGCQTLLEDLQDFLTFSTEPHKAENNNKKNQLIIDKTQVDEDIKLSKYYDSIALDNAFDTLKTNDQKNLYLRILDFSEDYLEKKNEKGFYTSPIFGIHNCNLTSREVAMIYEAVIEDNPQIFWFSDWYAYSINEDSVQFQLYFNMSEKKMKKQKQQLNAVINHLLSGLKKGMSEFELELYFHDYIVKNCVYDKKAVKEKNKDSFSVYGALVMQKAVCQGYTEAFQLLLSYVGINSYRIVGESQGVNHIWNVVELNGDKYYVDVTWDDTKDFCMYDYFNITSKQLKKDHTIAKMYEDCTEEEIKGKNSINFNLLSAKCTDTKYNYYIYKGCHLESYENHTITEDLIKLANRREKYLHLYVEPDFATVEEAYDKLFGKNTYIFSGCIKEANKQLERKFKTNTYVSIKPNLNAITVELVYKGE